MPQEARAYEVMRLHGILHACALHTPYIRKQLVLMPSLRMISASVVNTR